MVEDVPKHIQSDDWDAEQRRRDRNFDRRIAEWAKVTGPKRKVPLLLDQNIEDELVEKLRASKSYFRIARLPDGSDDGRL